MTAIAFAIGLIPVAVLFIIFAPYPGDLLNRD